MRGFGTPSSFALPTAATDYGWGFGSPTPGTWSGSPHDWAFGDPTPLAVSVVVATSPDRLPDDGGELVKLFAAWKEQGPWYVRVRPSGGSLSDYCHSAIPSKGVDCYTGKKADGSPSNTLRFVLPAGLAVGTYDVVVETGPSIPVYAKAELSNAFEVVYRGRTPHTYRLRSRLSRQISADVRILSLEELLTASDDFPHGGFQALTHAIGQEIQRQTHRPTTRLRQTYSQGDTTLHVETTLGFPTSGAVYVEGYWLTYSGRTGTTLTGVAGSVGGVALPIRAEVQLNVAALQPD